MIKLSLMNYGLIFLLSIPVFSHSATFDMEILKNIALSQHSMQKTIIDLGDPDGVGLSSEDSEVLAPSESDNIVFHYEGDIRLSKQGETYKCRIMIFYDKGHANNVVIALFRQSEKKVDPKEVTAIWGNEKVVQYKKFTDESPEAGLVDSDSKDADVEYWIYDKIGINVNIFRYDGNQVGQIEISRNYLR